MERANNARLQVIPSITAPAATIKMATVAVTAVTAVANHRHSRSRLALGGATCGKANSIAGRVSTGIESLQTSNREKSGFALRVAARYGTNQGDCAEHTVANGHSDKLSSLRSRAFAAIPQQ
jgi:hypothetical protein